MRSPGSSTTASRSSPASPAPAPAPPAPTPWRHRPSPTAPSRSPPATRPAQLDRHQLHAHERRRCTDRWRADSQHRRRERRRHPELRRRRHVHDRRPHRLHRRALGLASSTLTREQGTLNADACSAYGAPTTLVGTPAQSGLATGCYRYSSPAPTTSATPSTVTTVVKVDTSAPAAPGLVLSDSSADVHTTGTTAFYRPAGAAPSTSPLRRPTASPGSSTTASRPWPASPAPARAPPAPTPWRRPPSRTAPSRSRPQPGPAQLGRHQLHPHLRLGRAGQWRTDSQYGCCERRRDSELRRRRRVHDRRPHRLHGCTLGDCDLDADPGAGHAERRRLLGLRRAHHSRRHPGPERPATGCYRYVLTGTDNVGNSTSITTVVKVDTTAPAAPGLVLSDSSADVHTTGTTAFYRPAGSGSFDVTASSTDGQSGILDYGFPALAGFTGSGAGATRTYTLRRRPSRTAPSPSPLATRRRSAPRDATSRSPPTRPCRPVAR